MALIICAPSAFLTPAGTEPSFLVTMAAIIAAVLIFIEYYSESPSIVEFRNAPPYNRLRYFGVATMLLALTLMAKHDIAPTQATQAMHSIGTILGSALDFPFSPVRLVVLMMPDSAPAWLLFDIRAAASISYIASLVLLMSFIVSVRVLDWPVRSGAFNVWINLPLFDPTAGGDVLHRLKRDASINIALGLLLPFLIPAVVKLTSNLIDPMMLADPSTLIWTTTAWAFLPSSMIMRGIAMGRVAELIEEKRKETYAQSEEAAHA
ncbi:hypothetical protein [Pseudaestuariivita atlantica]|uniref:Membrane protein n=1 Tax=Pseudaestuariivita atlantica TaxID=1317121 RepID=A0A0L1JNQ1_9RHOB|nr:hypothetical protein [Pseudaestuariivita atlantica]KNG93389.1 membrane protein [Pseudaestuariivita atlantica]